MRLLFTVTPDEGDPYELTCDSRDVLKWEDDKPGRRASDLLTGQYGMRDFYALSWAAAKRLGLYSGDLKSWQRETAVESGHQITKAAQAKAAAEDQDDEDDDTVPTRPAL